MRPDLDFLKNIKKVDAPEFLLTRIMQQVKEQNNPLMTKRTVFAYGMAIMLVFCLDFYVLERAYKNNGHNSTMLQSFNLDQENDLYHD